MKEQFNNHKYIWQQQQQQQKFTLASEMYFDMHLKCMQINPNCASWALYSHSGMNWLRKKIPQKKKKLGLI